MIPTGNAKALITIKEIKYLSKNPKGTAIDFDSTKEADKKNAMENLIGQSYVVKLSPNGEVVAVEDVQKAREAVKGDSMEQKTAQSLLADDAIKQRHTITCTCLQEGCAGRGRQRHGARSRPAGRNADAEIIRRSLYAQRSKERARPEGRRG